MDPEEFHSHSRFALKIIPIQTYKNRISNIIFILLTHQSSIEHNNMPSIKIFSFVVITLAAFIMTSQARFLLVELDGAANEEIDRPEEIEPLPEEAPLEEDNEPEVATIKERSTATKKGLRAGNTIRVFLENI